MAPTRLFEAYADGMDELRRRGLVRSENNPVSDYAELVVSQTLDLKLMKGSTKGVDARDGRGTRYQIKGRRLVGRGSRQLGVIRDLEKRPFDVCVAILFDHKFRPSRVYRIPIGAIEKHGKFSKHQNGWIVQVGDRLISDKRVKDITRLFAKK